MALAERAIAVVGGGIAGLAAALALARRGARVEVFEQAPALGEVGAGLQVSPNGVAVLEALGLGETVAALASRPEAVELVDHRRGRLVARLPLGRTIELRHGRPFWQLHRADLLAALAAAAAAAGVELRLGTAVAAVEAGGGGAARLRLADGATAEAALVVAADGVRSGLRAALDPAPARFAGHVAWRGLVPAGRLPADLARPAARVTIGPGRHLVSYPLRGGLLVNVVAIERRTAWAEEGWSTPGDPAALRRAFAGWGGPAGALLAEIETCWLWGLFDHAPLARWSDGRRLVLVGDACHPMLPFLAQGATMALEDAWVLAAALDREPDQGRALATYAAARLRLGSSARRRAAAGSITSVPGCASRRTWRCARRAPWRRRYSPGVSTGCSAKM
jgi:salicylate hydroxylase